LELAELDGGRSDIINGHYYMHESIVRVLSLEGWCNGWVK
jgi:hypothetical protein